jgi:hypothetical protein
MPARAQLLQITASGEITGATGSYSTIPLGTAFTFTETFNVANATTIASTGTSATYQDATGTSSFSFGGFNFSGTVPQVEIYSNNQTLYGFEFSQPLPNNESYGVQLLSVDSFIAPSTSLASLQTYPLSDFLSGPGLGNEAVFNGEEGPGNTINGVGGEVTSFSVESVPEPSSAALVFLGVSLLLGSRIRQRRACVMT